MNTRVKNAIDKDDNINVELDEDTFADSGQYAKPGRRQLLR